ncbi:MAG: ABC transporter ATP-binding protein [Oryzihumus sp.]
MSSTATRATGMPAGPPRAGGLAVETVGLTKRYGRAVGIEDLDLQVRVGEVFGFLGPNGAGKTTTIRLLLGLIHPTAGRVSLFGMDLATTGPRIRAHLGYVPGDLSLWERMHGHDVLGHLALLRGGVPDRAWRTLAERFDLDLGPRVRELSKGNRQKLGLVQALMHEPDLLVLDEPTTGLDPLVQVEFHAVLRELVARGATVFLSSHVLAEVEQVADRAAIVARGRLLVEDDIEALRGQARRRIELDFPQDVPPGLADVPGVADLRVVGGRASCSVTGSLTELLRLATSHGVVDVHTHEPDLEDAFVGYVSAAPAAGMPGPAPAASPS